MDISPGLAVAYSGIILMPLLPIYIGAQRSLTQKSTETMTANKAYMFPLVGSCVLFGLYLLFKFFSKEYINFLLTGYFLLLAVGALTTTLLPWFESLVPKKDGQFISLATGLFQSEIVQWTWHRADLLSFLISVVVAVWYSYDKFWIINNIIGIAFCIQTIALLSLGSYRVSCILLIGLFFYDIFWVFGTDVMVTVAKSFDAPVKLLFPRDIFAADSPFSMLGLGDIVFPGILIALMLRFDIYLSLKASKKKRRNTKIYFLSTFAGYVFGLFLTIFVMHTFKAAQPALLYLVPTCLGSSFLVAFLRGELKELWNYTEEDEEEKASKAQNKSKTAKQKSPKQNKKQQNIEQEEVEVEEEAEVEEEVVEEVEEEVEETPVKETPVKETHTKETKKKATPQQSPVEKKKNNKNTPAEKKVPAKGKKKNGQ
jgi:minor histocompatibility antigen H13